VLSDFVSQRRIGLVEPGLEEPGHLGADGRRKAKAIDALR
jgi:hypothetical protein